MRTIDLGLANAYLLRGASGFSLIDTGPSNKRRKLIEALAAAGCGPGDLELLILTHGDFDHTGNAATLQAEYGAEIAMHAQDAGMAEHGDMLWNREVGKKPVYRILMKAMLVVMRMGNPERFRPDVLLEDGQELSEYGLAARVLHLPGHSKGSIGILTAEGDLYCGDLFMNNSRPGKTSLVDDAAALDASMDSLRGLGIRMVYPGHGGPFPLEAVMTD